MTSRIVAIGMLVALLGVVGAFMAIAVIGPRDAGTDREPTVLTQDMGKWRLQAQLVLAGSGTYELALRIVDEGGGPASLPGGPEVRLSMLDHDMGTTSLPIEPVGVGTYRAVGSLDMEGRWRFQIELASDQADMIVNFRR